MDEVSPGHRSNILNPHFRELDVRYCYDWKSEYGCYWISNLSKLTKYQQKDRSRDTAAFLADSYILKDFADIDDQVIIQGDF